LGQNSYNNSIVKAFHLLEFFTPDKQSWGVRELAQHLNANKSTTYRLMATLSSIGVLKKDTATDKYSLGLKLFELGNRVDINHSIISKTHPILEQVAAEITETVHLGILKNHQVLMIDKLESPMGLKLNSTTGAYSPIHCTGLGKVLLSGLSPTLFENYLDQIKFEKFTKHTITSKTKFKKEIQTISKQGYALDKEEKELGLICVAVPVFNQQNEMIAALSAAGPAQRFKENKLKGYVNTLQKGAAKIRLAVGNFNTNFI